MPLNPFQLGEEVVEQFQRYLLTYFPIADRRLEEQVKAALEQSPAGERMLVRGPYIQLNQPFEEGPLLKDFVQQHGLHPAIPGIFRPIEQLHKHQELAATAVENGKHTVIATATGSGKTEAFLLPIIDHCLRLRDDGAPPGVVAVLVYPMNALVNDQLQRLRTMLAGTQITFARYTGETPPRKPDDVTQLEQPRPYTDQELRDRHEKGRDLPLPWEERFSREEIVARPPRILLTNYYQLEYLLLRARDLELFEDAPLRYLVIDEVHTYTGALGSEVACLLRRLRYLSGKSPDEVRCIGASATVQDPEGKIDGVKAVRNFAHRLFGVPEEDIEVVEEQYKDIVFPSGRYDPPVPANAEQMLNDVLEASHQVHLMDEMVEIPDAVVQVAERLCGHEAPAGEANQERLYDLLVANSVVQHLARSQTSVRELEDTLSGLRQIGERGQAERENLVAELLAYLTLGALAQREDEPLLRPKLHYFVQGYQGMAVSFEPTSPIAGESDELAPIVHFAEKGTEGRGDGIPLPLLLCRACGQHYFRVIVGEPTAADYDGQSAHYYPVRILDERQEREPDENVWYLTDQLHTEEEEHESRREVYYMCRYCGALHESDAGKCLNGKCQREGPMVRVIGFQGEPKTCAACGAPNWTLARTISGTRSRAVQDVMILAQSLLTAMQEDSMRKLLIFADNRQDAAFQAGWMKERSKRVWLRHLLYQILNTEPSRAWSLEDLSWQLLAEGQAHGIVAIDSSSDDKEHRRIRWFLLQEFASRRDRRGSLETLGLATVVYPALTVEADRDFFERWGATFAIEPHELVDTVRLILDYYRRRGALSDELMTHWWRYADPDVRQGVIQAHEHWAPTAVSLRRAGQGTITKALIATNGRASAELIVKKAAQENATCADEFLEELWDWLTEPERRLVVPVTLTKRSRGRIEAMRNIGPTFQVNGNKMAIEHSVQRYLCDVCRGAQGVALPSERCPEYGCRGKTHQAGSDEDHFAVVQYTKLPLVPLRPAEHTAQVSKEGRSRIEEAFQQEDGEVNCIVCTPTLELGVDIGKLEMALMRNVPPTPANYAQRAGRAGRKHRIAVVFSYCGGSPHDRYFFQNPSEMISGSIRVPAFSMRNEPLVRKHAHSAILTELRRAGDEQALGILEEAFPLYVWKYFGRKARDADGQERFHYSDEPPDSSGLRSVVAQFEQLVVQALTRAFTETWPKQDMEVVGLHPVTRLISQMPVRLEAHVQILWNRVRAYRTQLATYRRITDSAELTSRDRRLRGQLEHALDRLRGEDQDNYVLSYLSSDGFLPGYAMSRESCVARSLEPYKEFSRPAAVALREFAPTSWLYADGNVFRVSRLELHDPADRIDGHSPIEPRRENVLDRDTGGLRDPAALTTEGGPQTRFDSLLLAGAELRANQPIDDLRDARTYVGYDVRGMLLDEHGGGWRGKVGDRAIEYLRRQRLRLVNLGPIGAAIPAEGGGFVICPYCGGMRSPHASDTELADFVTRHHETCGIRELELFALHVEFDSDVLLITPFASEADAVNAMTGLLAGAGQVLDMGVSELEGLVLPETVNSCSVLIYDPIPGGSGLIEQITNHWVAICEKGITFVASCQNCPEDEACYGCLKSYRNQRYHDELSRAVACQMLETLATSIVREHDIPPQAVQRTDSAAMPESDSESQLEQILDARHFPMPAERQYRVDLDGDTTVADFAYPDDKVLIYVDGLSARIHGDPQTRRSDVIRRAKAEAKGYRVLAISAQGLSDDQQLDSFLSKLAIYLGREDLL